MAYAVSNQSAGISGDFLTRTVASIKASFARRAVYKRTLAELKTLNDRDFADLGIHRSQIHAIAYDAAYGK